MGKKPLNITTKKGTLSFEDVRKDFVVRRDFDKLLRINDALCKKNKELESIESNKKINQLEFEKEELEKKLDNKSKIIEFYKKRFGIAYVCSDCEGTGKVIDECAECADEGDQSTGVGCNCTGELIDCGCNNGIIFEKPRKRDATLIEDIPI